jgi:gamma-glutamylputrescine oxidase
MFEFQPRNQLFWTICRQDTKRCTQNFQTQVAIVGGGIAGLSAAQAWSNAGKKVAVFEQFYCGSGATGKSTGFVTPNAELSFTNISNENNVKLAHQAWNFINDGVEKIRNNIKNNNFSCGYVEQKGLYVANCQRALKAVIQEHKDLIKINYASEYFNKTELKKILNSDRYLGGVSYNNSFGINPYEYCKEMKKHLTQKGVVIFEETPILTINDHKLTTPHATITADIIIVCVDKFLPQFGLFKNEIYNVQNFVMTSEKLTSQEIAQIFPKEQYMIWDSELVYNFYRIIEHNRLVLGGGDIFSFYSKKEDHNNYHAYKKLSQYFNNTFPELKISFEYQWPGHFGISKDIGPIAGRDKKHPHIYYISGAAGLPIATQLGFYSMEHIMQGRTDLDKFFDPDRKYFISGLMQKILGKRISFALNHFIVQQIVGCFK